MIVGDPHNGCLNRCVQTYDVINEGDCILDLHPYEPSQPSYNLNDTYLSEFPNDSYVIFESKTFNFSNNIERLLAEATRVSGGDLFCTGSNTGGCWKTCGRHAYHACTREGVPTFSLSMYSPSVESVSLRYFNTGESVELTTVHLNKMAQYKYVCL